MTVGGTVSKPIFIKDGQYLSFTCDNAVTLGNVVKLTTTGTDTCDVGSVASGHPTILGVAVSGDRFSRTATDNVIAAGGKVTVCTRGVVYVLGDASAIVIGSFVEAGAAGTVGLSGAATGGAGTTHSAIDIIGVALDANTAGGQTIRVALMRF